VNALFGLESSLLSIKEPPGVYGPLLIHTGKAGPVVTGKGRNIRVKLFELNRTEILGMIRDRRWHFVNEAGEPLDARYEIAAPYIEKYFSKNFPRVDPADLDDVIESSATRVARRETTRGRVGDLNVYLFRAVRNAVSDLLQKASYRAKKLEAPLSDDERALAVLSVRRNGLGSDGAVAMREALNNLDAREQEILSASIEGYSSAEIAAMFDMTEGNVRVVLCRARKELTRILGGCRCNGESDQ